MVQKDVAALRAEVHNASKEWLLLNNRWTAKTRRQADQRPPPSSAAPFTGTVDTSDKLPDPNIVMVNMADAVAEGDIQNLIHGLAESMCSVATRRAASRVEARSWRVGGSSSSLSSPRQRFRWSASSPPYAAPAAGDIRPARLPMAARRKSTSAPTSTSRRSASRSLPRRSRGSSAASRWAKAHRASRSPAGQLLGGIEHTGVAGLGLRRRWSLDARAGAA